MRLIAKALRCRKQVNALDAAADSQNTKKPSLYTPVRLA